MDTCKKSNSISIHDVFFYSSLLILNGSAILVLSYSSFAIAFGVTFGTVDMTLSDVADMCIQYIIVISTFLIINLILIFAYRSKNLSRRLSNPFKRKRTIGEIMAQEDKIIGRDIDV
ncbi:hypothetical protein ABC382_00205 [Lysinibacillus sp. 1P01SD]|uniref:hypothetical protein n=1 Tax=Lysinibacillus sp. 1P01SD TaxID=3132285 RepID=UPI0039A0B0A1